jgi:chemotaxis protein MotB
MSRLRLFALAASASLLSVACVSQGKYEEAVRNADAARSELAKTKQEMQRRERIADEGRAEMQKQVDDATAVYDELTKQLERLGQDAQSLLALNGSLKDSLDGSKKRLEELRRAQAAAEARASLYRDLALRFESMVDAGDLAISLRDGRMILRLSNDVLFDSGRSELKPDGKRALSQIAAVLATVPNRQFQIAGHTDDEPIRLSPYKSNWDLSTARALEVTSFLVSRGIDPHALSAAGYGEFDPIDTNTTGPGKSHNRRTEITVQPNIDELVAIPDAP